MPVDYGVPLGGITLLTSECSSCYFNIGMVTLAHTSLLMIEIFVFAELYVRDASYGGCSKSLQTAISYSFWGQQGVAILELIKLRITGY